MNYKLILASVLASFPKTSALPYYAMAGIARFPFYKHSLAMAVLDCATRNIKFMDP